MREVGLVGWNKHSYHRTTLDGARSTAFLFGPQVLGAKREGGGEEGEIGIKRKESQTKVATLPDLPTLRAYLPIKPIYTGRLSPHIFLPCSVMRTESPDRKATSSNAVHGKGMYW